MLATINQIHYLQHLAITMYSRDEFYFNSQAGTIIVQTDDGKGIEIFRTPSGEYFNVRFQHHDIEVSFVTSLSFQQAYDIYMAFFFLNK